MRTLRQLEEKERNNTKTFLLQVNINIVIRDFNDGDNNLGDKS